MALEKHVVELSARDTLSPALKNVGREADNAGRKAEDAGRRATRSTQDWSRAASALGAGLGILGVAAVKLAAESEQAQARLEQSIENTGHAYDEYADSIDRASKAALQLAFDDEDAINAISALTDVTGDASRAISDLAIAEDIARGRGINLAAATQIVIAAETGRIGSLRRLGIMVDDNASKEEVLALLQAKYAGQAEAYAETTGASYERMGNRIENVLESIGGAADDVLLPILALSSALPLLTSAAGALAGTAALGGVAAGLLAIAPAAAALAAPVGIATYLFIDQSRVMREATEETLKNKDALEGYIEYLNSIDLPSEQVEQMSEDMKVLVDWVTKVGDQIDSGIIQTAPNLKPFTTNLGELDDTIRGLNPENLDNVLRLANQLGIVFGDPLTWNPDAINALANYMVYLAQEEANAEYAAIELTRAQSNLNDMMSGTAAATAETSIEMVRAGARIKTVTEVFGEWVDALTEANHLITDPAVIAALIKQEQVAGELAEAYLGLGRNAQSAATGLGSFGSVSGETALDMRALTDSLEALDASLTDVGAEGLDRAYQSIVGFTSGIVSSIGTAQQWADALIAPVGVYSELDNLLAAGKISLEDYNEAQQAQIDITDALGRAQTASNVIQAVNAEIIADQATATADYLESLSGLPQEEQLVQLAWANTDIAGRANDIAGMAASFDDMSTAQQDAFEEMVTSAAATDPALAAVLESLGLIKKDVNDPTGWSLAMGTSDAESDIDRLNDTMVDFIKLFDPSYVANLDVNDMGATARAGLKLELFAYDNSTHTTDLDANSEPFWTAVDALPETVGTRYIDVVARHHDGGYYDRPGYALGGVVPYGGDTAALGRMTRGNMTLVGEHGPELALLPGGTTVIPNHASRYMGDRGGGITFNGPITIVANDPQSFMRQIRNYSETMARR